MNAARELAHSPAVARLSTPTLALKRVLDVLGSLAGLLILWPFLLGIAIAIKLDSPGPVFFRQIRIGRGGRPFRIVKFRSMVAGAPQLGKAITARADSRITRAGAFLRGSKLDELPQLINVLMGDMSLVGPRPEVPEFMNFYTPEQRAIILSLRPGMTDYASILFRDESSLLDGQDNPVEIYQHEIMPVKFAYYERYSRDVGLINDVRIIIATVSLLAFKHVPERFGIEHELPLRKPQQML
jgi:lipopolysaccharide/colanic/teichoic acid biosynthesis glycosyltransferase